MLPEWFEDKMQYVTWLGTARSLGTSHEQAQAEDTFTL
jgi:hypothetical protein